MQPEVNLSLIDMAVKGGWLMIPLVLLSIISIYLFGMKWLEIRKAAGFNPQLLDQVGQLLAQGKKDEAIALCKEAQSPIAKVVEKGINKTGFPIQDVQVSLENTANIEVATLEKGLPYLATIAGGAPMIGFLGTVMGMVQAFFNMAAAGSNIDITLLSGGIYTAMVTTVAGLIVGIMAYFGYNFLTSKVADVVLKMQFVNSEFIDMLQERVIKR